MLLRDGLQRAAPRVRGASVAPAPLNGGSVGDSQNVYVQPLVFLFRRRSHENTCWECAWACARGSAIGKREWPARGRKLACGPGWPRASEPARWWPRTRPVSTTGVTALPSQAPEPAGARGLDASSWHSRSLEIRLFFLQSPQDGFYSDFEVCHWIEYHRNKPADFYLVNI